MIHVSSAEYLLPPQSALNITDITAITDFAPLNPQKQPVIRYPKIGGIYYLRDLLFICIYLRIT